MITKSLLSLTFFLFLFLSIETAVHRSRRAVVPRNVRLWPQGIVPYEMKHLGNSRTRKMINTAMRHFEAKTCIQFVEKDWEDVDYIDIVGDEQGCYSSVGRRGGRQVVNLSSDCNRLDAILHELGHVIGLEHEHQRPDRDDHIPINLDNLSQNQRDSLSKLSSSEVVVLSPYDFDSIMHYNALQTRHGTQTIVSRNNREHSRREVLSSYDCDAIRHLYGCESF